MVDLTARENESLRVQKVGQVYRNKGYDVLIEPQGDQLPDFLQTFRPDLIAHKGDEHIVVEVTTPNAEAVGLLDGYPIKSFGHMHST